MMLYMSRIKIRLKWYENLTKICQFGHNWNFKIRGNFLCNYFLLDDFQVFYLLHEEGFFVGASTGLNVAAAVQVFNETALI